MDRHRRQRGTIATQGLTPLLDVLFILLFALLALSESQESRSELVHIRLPRVESSALDGAASEKSIVVAIDERSRLLWPATNDILESMAALDELLARETADTLPENLHVRIHADREARHGVAVQVLQHLRVRGFVSVSLLADGGLEDGLEREDR